MPKRAPTIAETALALIEERGPLTLEELGAEMAALGRTRAKDPVVAVRDALRYANGFLEGQDGRWYSLRRQLEGAVFTIAPTALERAEGILLVRDDLDLVRELLVRGRRPDTDGEVHIDSFAAYFDLPHPADAIIGIDEDGEPIMDDTWDLHHAVSDEQADLFLSFLDELGVPRGDDEASLRDFVWEMADAEILHGPADWMPALRSREVLGLEIRGGRVHAVALDQRALKGMHVESAIALVNGIAKNLLDEEEGLGAPAVPITGLLSIIATDSPEIFRKPLPPLSHLLERAGFEVEDGLVGLPGAAWDDIRWALDPNPEAAWGFEPGDKIN